jgi:hypothetical protein
MPKRDEMTGGWRKLPNIIRMVKFQWAGHAE